MTIQDRLNLIKQVGEEIVTEGELIKLLESGEELIAYDGFEPSGQMHIAQGLVRAININKIIKAGIKFKMLVADWHAMTNNKLGGDLKKIQTVGQYFIEVWRACGMDLKNVEFVWASDMVKNPDYWQLVIKIGTTNKLPRFIRTAEFMGREAEGANLTAAQMFYPCMQIADIFLLGAKITQLGMDQRKINMLAREIGPLLSPPTGGWKPVVVSHHMLMGLQQSQISNLNPSTNSKLTLSEAERVKSQNQNLDLKTENDMDKENKNRLAKAIALKMSKSNPDSAIFMTDNFEDIKRKINKAYCPEGETKENPILEYCKYIIFESFDRLVIERPEKFGGSLILNSFQDLEKVFFRKELHPQDLKNTVIDLLDQLLAPVRKHFEENGNAKRLLEKVTSYQVTR